MKKLLQNVYEELNLDTLFLINGGYSTSSSSSKRTYYGNFSSYANLAGGRSVELDFTADPNSYALPTSDEVKEAIDTLTGGSNGGSEGGTSSNPEQPKEPITASNPDGDKGSLAKVDNGIAWILGTEYSDKHIITSEYGDREAILGTTFDTDNFHDGIDIAAEKGTRINSLADGIVTKVVSDSDTGYGNYVVITHQNGTTSLYAHCDTIGISCGTKVSAGEQIATVGSTGNSTGNHVHFSFDGNGDGDYTDGESDNPLSILFGGTN